MGTSTAKALWKLHSDRQRYNGRGRRLIHSPPELINFGLPFLNQCSVIHLILGLSDNQ